ncbi:MAG: hypothetical protein JXA10_09475 [Anaerolineae bacterium]|nr:hypothetical protein [Anaerolineae bacterium]
MSRSVIELVVILIIVGVALTLGFYTNSTLGGVLGGVIIGVLGRRRWERSQRRSTKRLTEQLMTILIDMGDTLQETSPDALQRRGGWNQPLFDQVLAHIEQQAPQFQHALIAYLAQPGLPATPCVTALLAVDRLSAAYTYWTRLFPPRQSDESMFVLSLLQDLSEKVELAITRLDDQLTLL